MTLKNNLRRGQVSLEYFILFAIIATLTIISLTSGGSFITKIQNATQGMFQKGVDRMVK